MISRKQAEEFACEWIAAWNAQDLERVLAHYTDDFEFSSPFIISQMNEASGTLKGKALIHIYWQSALERFPDLRFELIEVFSGVQSVTIYYKTVFGKTGAEVFIFDANGKVIRSLAHYND
jgi:ketosteroid isomerase-like protein